MSLPSLPTLPALDRIALFLDFDGTLVELAEHPEAVVMDAVTLDTLVRLHGDTGGAVAIVTGRDIAVIDRFLAPLELPVAGIHGLTRRDAGRKVHLPPDGEVFLDAAEQALREFAARESGLLIERKTASIALHFRARPELEAQCIDRLETLARDFSGIEVKRGKMVVEAKPDHADKGTAIADFMAEPPFAGRVPVFAGDDVTDEDAFRVVNRLGGISIKIGCGATAARYSTQSRGSFIAWLGELAGSDGQREER